MDIFKIYDQLSAAKIAPNEMRNLYDGFLTHLALKNCEWTSMPCRLVYHQPNSVSMVVLPFFVPQLSKLIWGIEVDGIYLSLEERKSEEHFNGYMVTQAFGDSALLFGPELAKQRSFNLPTANDLTLLWNPMLMEDIDDTLTMLARVQYTYGMKISFFHDDALYFVKTSPNEAQKAYSSREEQPSAAASALTRYVLYADNDVDCFCSVNRFGVPCWGALQKCMERLGVPDNEAYRQFTKLRNQYPFI